MFRATAIHGRLSSAVSQVDAEVAGEVVVGGVVPVVGGYDTASFGIQ